MFSCKTRIISYTSDYNYYGIIVPADVCADFKTPGNKRILCTIDQHPPFPAALLPDGNGSFFIMLSKQRMKDFKLTPGSEAEVIIDEDTSKYGMPLPEEMEILLEQDEEGSRLFHQLTPGKQRSILYMVGKIKSSQKRIDKAIAIMEYLKSSGGRFDFKAMSEFIKYYNSGF
jgi:hypothetical protein